MYRENGEHLIRLVPRHLPHGGRLWFGANKPQRREVFAFFVVGVDVLGDPFRREILFSHRRAGGNVCVTNLPFSVA